MVSKDYTRKNLPRQRTSGCREVCVEKNSKREAQQAIWTIKDRKFRVGFFVLFVLVFVFLLWDCSSIQVSFIEHLSCARHCDNSSGQVQEELTPVR